MNALSDLALIFNVVQGPTTDRMDRLYSAEDVDNKHKVMVQCRGCAGWTLAAGQRGVMGAVSGVQCEHCGSDNFDPHSTTSLRSYNPLAAKKRVPKGKKKR